jgi:8-oxo-dGTP pyrophosphatase MutT (NUDIX family)
MAGEETEGSSGGSAEEPPRPKRRRRRGRRAAKRPRATGTPKTGASTTAAAAAAARQGAGRRKKQVAHRHDARAGRKTAAQRGRRQSPLVSRRFPTTKEVSAGGVVYRRTDDGDIEVVLASRRTRRGELAWGLAKGGIERGESRRRAAVREVREETGLIAEIESDLGDTRYMYVWEDVRIRKTVHFFLMRPVGGDIADRDDEMEDVRWFPLERAMKRAAYRGERDILGRAAGLLR